MTQIIVSIENYSTIDKIVNAIKMLKGVSDAYIWDQSLNAPVQQTERKYSDRINRLRSLCGKGISQEEIDNDERYRHEALAGIFASQEDENTLRDAYINEKYGL